MGEITQNHCPIKSHTIQEAKKKPAEAG